MLNHVPVIGTAFGLAMVGWALLRRSEELKKISLGVFVIVALLGIPAYLTGEPAEELVENLPGVSKLDTRKPRRRDLRASCSSEPQRWVDSFSSGTANRFQTGSPSSCCCCP